MHARCPRSGPHGRPWYLGCCTTVRLWCCSPPPHVSVQRDHALHAESEQSTGGLHEAVNALVDGFGPPSSEHAASYSPELADGLYVSAAGGLPLMEKGGDGRGGRRKRVKGGAMGGAAREKSAGARRKSSSASAPRQRH